MDNLTKYLINVETEYSGPPILVILYKYSFVYDNLFVWITAIIQFLFKLFTGKSLEENKYIFIYERISVTNKRTIYKEKIPAHVQEHEISKKVYLLEKLIENGQIEEFSKSLINGDKVIFG